MLCLFSFKYDISQKIMSIITFQYTVLSELRSSIQVFPAYEQVCQQQLDVCYTSGERES